MVGGNGEVLWVSGEEMKVVGGKVGMWEDMEKSGKGKYGGGVREKLNE